ncbi:MAG TPA: HlyC/CorC family transporter [Candidatus Hydrogenedentes bacterium]|nr:HlyC/CorC family transporter [Candidatus Hydrogenedentota bacterium]
MDDDGSSSRRTRIVKTIALLICIAAIALCAGPTEAGEDVDPDAGNGAVTPAEPARRPDAVAADAGTQPAARARSWVDALPVSILGVIAVLLVFSAFFSSCETAFLSISRPRLRSLRAERGTRARLVVQMLEHPGRLLTTILVGNMFVNVLIGVLLGTRTTDLFKDVLGLPPTAAYLLAVAACTAVLLLFGEILPKIFAVRAREAYARIAVIPLAAADKGLSPVRDGLLRLTDFLFRVTRFHELRAAPYITDDELKSALSAQEAGEVIEDEERQIIRRILEFRDVVLREILVPRLDMIALPEDATTAVALDLLRRHEYSRMPVYRENLDNITGVLFVKDLLPAMAKGELDTPVKAFARPPHFVPETMSVHAFVKSAQRLRTHLAIVVDEYGGTEGLVTLQDAIEEVVGDIQDENGKEKEPYQELAPGSYRVEGSLPLDELSELLDVRIEDEEHETVAGYLMNQTDKIPEVADEFVFDDLRFTIEAVDGKRASTVRIDVLRDNQGRQAGQEGGK